MRFAEQLSSYGIRANRLGYNGSNEIALTPTGVFLGYPTGYHEFGALSRLPDRYGLTMFESSKIDDSWVHILNKMRGVIVPSRYCEDVFKECGVSVPVKTVSLGVDDTFSYQERPGQEKFRILTIGDRGARKGALRAAFAFERAFGKSKKHELVIKSRSPLTFFGGNLKIRNENIVQIVDSYDDKTLDAFYKTFDAMMFLSSGEGFGLPPREFARTGGIAICTNYSGLSDDIHEWGEPVDKYQLSDAWVDDPAFQHLGKWAEADVDSAAETLTRVYEKSREERNEFGARVSGFVKRHYTWSGFTKSVIDFIGLSK